MNAPKKNVQRPVWNHLLLLGRCSSIVGKSRVQRSGLGPHCTAPARWGWRLARRSRIEIALSVLKRPPSPSERLIAHSVRPSSGGGVEWSKSRTVSYSNRRHGAIIAPTPTTARSTDRRAKGDGDVCGAKDVFVHSAHNSWTACNASAAKTMRCPNTACIVPMFSPFPLQLNIVHIVEQAGMRLENRSNEGKTITAARFPWLFLPRERDAWCKCRDGGRRDACTALHLT